MAFFQDIKVIIKVMLIKCQYGCFPLEEGVWLIGLQAL
jgi:hypothetical protein